MIYLPRRPTPLVIDRNYNVFIQARKKVTGQDVALSASILNFNKDGTIVLERIAVPKWWQLRR